MKKFSALIVDDEKLAREDLKVILNDFQEIEIAGEASSVDEAIEFLKTTSISLVFLDIQMPKQSGFELLRYLDKGIKVIFVTAFDEFAIKAFEVNAHDYILKPVSPIRLSATIEKLKGKTVSDTLVNKKLNVDDSIFIMFNNSFQFIKIQTIKRITSAGNYSEILYSDMKKGLVMKSMKEWEERLPENRFVRIHKNTIVNLDYIEKVEEWFNSAFKIYMKGESESIIMSRRYAAKLKDNMK